MLLSRIARRLLNPTLAPATRSLQNSQAQPYISKKELDQIEKEYGTSTSERLRMYSKQAKLIYSQGWAALKNDYSTYISLRQKEQNGDDTLTREELKLKKRMWQEIQGLKTLVVIQILPFSGPLLIYYIYVYPTSIPSWFSVDALHENYQLQCIRTQAEAIAHFQQHPLDTTHLQLSHLTIEQLKKLSELLFGHYEDGLTGYNKLRPEKVKQYLFHPRFSKYLVTRNLKKEFEKEIYNRPELKGRPVNELVAEKYEKIMRGEELLQFEPVNDQLPVASKEDEEEPPR